MPPEILGEIFLACLLQFPFQRPNLPLYTGIISPEFVPNLRKLILSYYHPAVRDLHIIPFRDMKLTHLCPSGSRLSAHSWSSIIMQCTVLQHGIFVIDASISMHQAGRPTTLESLLTLNIVLLGTYGCLGMMDNLYFPSLRSFSFGHAKRLGAWNSRHFSPILYWISCEPHLVLILLSLIFRSKLRIF